MKYHISYKRINCGQRENAVRLVKDVLWTNELKCPLPSCAGFPILCLIMFIIILN